MLGHVSATASLTLIGRVRRVATLRPKGRTRQSHARPLRVANGYLLVAIRFLGLLPLQLR